MVSDLVVKYGIIILILEKECVSHKPLINKLTWHERLFTEANGRILRAYI